MKKALYKGMMQIAFQKGWINFLPAIKRICPFLGLLVFFFLKLKF